MKSLLMKTSLLRATKGVLLAAMVMALFATGCSKENLNYGLDVKGSKAYTGTLFSPEKEPYPIPAGQNDNITNRLTITGGYVNKNNNYVTISDQPIWKYYKYEFYNPTLAWDPSFTAYYNISNLKWEFVIILDNTVQKIAADNGIIAQIVKPFGNMEDGAFICTMNYPSFSNVIKSTRVNIDPQGNEMSALTECLGYRLSFTYTPKSGGTAVKFVTTYFPVVNYYH